MQQAEIQQCIQNTGMPLEKVKREQFCQTPLGWEKSKAGLWAACRNYRHNRWTQLPQTMQASVKLTSADKTEDKNQNRTELEL